MHANGDNQKKVEWLKNNSCFLLHLNWYSLKNSNKFERVIEPFDF